MRSSSLNNTLPISFKHVLSINCTVLEGKPDSGNILVAHVQNLSLSSFQRQAAWIGINNNNKSFMLGAVYVIAIGY